MLFQGQKTASLKSRGGFCCGIIFFGTILRTCAGGLPALMG